MKKDSELCLSVVTWFAVAGGHGGIASHGCPDDPQNTKGAPQGQKFVDLVAVAQDGTHFALEHTMIESYPQQLEEGRQIQGKLLPIEIELEGKLPLDRAYRLSIQAGAGLADTDQGGGVPPGLVQWVSAVAPTLPPGNPSTAPLHLTNAPPNLGIAASLSAWRPSSFEVGGRLTVWRHGNGDQTRSMEQRATRLRVALETKLPKLLANPEAETILVLEDGDLAMSNVSDVWVGLQVASEGLNLSDCIVVVETGGGLSIGTTVYSDGCWLEDFAANQFALPDV